MKTKLKLLVLVSALAFAGLALMLSTTTSAASSVPAETSRLASPYSAHCATCHGGDGRANTDKGREVDADDLTTGRVQSMSTAKMTKVIKNGKGDMPAFKNLSASQISSIIRTVKSF